MAGEGRVDISFVIPVRNDARRLERCLASIRANDYPVDFIEIIVVDNGSSDDSREVAAAAGATVLSVTEGTVSLLRNRGAGVASGDILAFVDADHTIAPSWIRRAVDSMAAQPEAIAVGTLCHTPQNGTWVQRAYDRLRGRTGVVGPTEWLGAGNLAVRRRAFDAAGGFDTALVTCEDVDLCKKLRLTGGLILNDPGLINVHHGDPETLSALFRGELWRGRSNLTVSFRPPIGARELPSAAIPVLELLGAATGVVVFATMGVQAWAIWLAALMPAVAFPLARATRMSRRGNQSAVEYLANTAVAFVYDAARALALVAFAGHGLRRS